MRCSIKLDTSGQFLNSIKSWWMWSNGMMKIKQWDNIDPNYSIYTAVQVFLWVVFTKTTTRPSMTKKTRTEFDPNHNCVQYNWVKSQQKYHLWSTVHFDVHFSPINAAPVHQSYQYVKEIQSSTTNLSTQEILTQIKNIWFIVRFTILKGKDTNSSLGIIRISKSD